MAASRSDDLVSVAITVRGSDSLPLDDAASTLVLDYAPAPFAATGYRPSFAIPPGTLGTGGSLTVTCDGYVTRTARVIMPVDPATGIRVENEASKKEPTAAAAYAVMDQECICQVTPTTPPEPPHPVTEPLLPLHVDGKWFRTSDGAAWTQIGCTDFRLLERVIRGEDVTPVLAERAALGFNQLRIFLMCDLMFRLHPQEHPEYWHALEHLLDQLATYGLRAELTVLVDATRVVPSTSQQQQFFAEVCETVAGMPHVFVELVNENDQTINVIDPAAFQQPGGLISSHGSKGVVDTAQQAPCVEPLWTYGTLHPPRPADWPRLGGHNTMEDVADRFGRPGTDNESCRPDQGRGPIPSDWFDAAANIALLCAGGTMHSQCGKDSRLFDALERPCAEAWVRGARAVPLAYQRGAYIAGHLSGYPIEWAPGDSSRAHGRLIGERACLSLPQMRDGYVPTARPGWTIVQVQGSVVECVGTPRAARQLLDEVDRDTRRRVH